MKDSFCSYYTDSSEITSYMTQKLGISDNDIILEPSAGEGVFIDQILSLNKKIRIDALDINEEAISILEKKYSKNTSVVVRRTDTLLDKELDLYSISELWLKQTDTLVDEQLDFLGSTNGYYNKVIGNPPYGAWQDYDKRALLKKKYKGQYVKETYTLFLLRCISVLKMHGRLSFIIPDTFLFLNMHEGLRKILLTNTKIDEILIFPSKFFPGVNFGYSNLSIITLQRCSKQEAFSNTLRIIRGFDDVSEFNDLCNTKEKKHLDIYSLKQEDIFYNPQHRFIIADEKVSSIISAQKQTLGDIADIVTGFYSGDNSQYIKALDYDVKGSKKYEKIVQNEIYECNSIEGVPNVNIAFVPFIKSASSTRYYRKTNEWFVRWDTATVAYYQSNKKSRFQNSQFYFQTGIAIPMVKSSTIRATLMENSIFDQSIVGIFPKDKTKLYYVLALMNSEIINDILHTINPTANNSANYVKQIPYIEDEQITPQIIKLVEQIIEAYKNGDEILANTLHQKTNDMIGEIYLK